MMEASLACVRPEECCVIQGVDLPEGQRRRLRDLGLLPGANIRCGVIAPSGSPMAFWIKGALIALRVEDCRQIRVLRSSNHED